MLPTLGSDSGSRPNSRSKSKGELSSGSDSRPGSRTQQPSSNRGSDSKDFRITRARPVRGPAPLDRDSSSRPGSQPGGLCGSLGPSAPASRRDSRSNSKTLDLRQSKQFAGAVAPAFGEEDWEAASKLVQDKLEGAQKEQQQEEEQEEQPEQQEEGTSTSEEEEEEENEGSEHAIRDDEIFVVHKRMTRGRMLMAVSDMLADQERYNQPEYCGLFIDFLVRSRNKKGFGEYAKCMLDPELKGELDLDAYSGGSDIVRGEKLQATIRNIIAHAYTKQGHPAFQSTGNEFMHHSQNLLRYKREELSLHYAVTMAHGFKQHLHKAAASQGTKTAALAKGKADRLKDFWTDYHTSHKLAHVPNELAKTEPRPASSAAAREAAAAAHKTKRLPTPGSTSRPGSQGGTLGRSASGPASAWYAHSSQTGKGGKQPEKQQDAWQEDFPMSNDDAWKLRSSRTLCSRGGSRSQSKSSKKGGGDSMSFPSLNASHKVIVDALKKAEKEQRVRASTLAASKDIATQALSAFFTTEQSPQPQKKVAGDKGRLSLEDWGFDSKSPLFKKQGAKPAGGGAEKAPPRGSIFWEQPPDWSDHWKGVKKNIEKMKTQKLQEILTSPDKSTPKNGLNMRQSKDIRWLSSSPELLNAWPAEQRQCTPPHGKEPGGHTFALQQSGSAPRTYIMACETLRSFPSLIPFCTGHSDKLEAANQALGDHDLLAVTEMMKKMDSLKEVDLGGNLMLTHRSLVPFFRSLKGSRIERHLEKLSIKQCMRKAGPEAWAAVAAVAVDTLSSGVERLKFLDLSGIPFQGSLQLQLCQAISSHPTLADVALNDARLGFDNPYAKRCVYMLAQSPLEKLELGWNAFDEEMFRLLGEGVAQKGYLERLSIPSCAGVSASSGSSTIDHFLEILENDTSLTELDISLNRVDFRGALILESALETNPRLCRVDISYNPLGILGFRSLLRLQGRMSNAFTSFDCAGCASGAMDSSSENGQVLTLTNPQGRYVLKLNKPYHRALMRMMYRTCHNFGLAPEVAFTDLHAPKSFKHPERSSTGSFPLPTEGEVTFTFSIVSAVEKSLEGVGDCDYAEVLRRVFTAVRINLDKHKKVAIAVQFKKMMGQSLEQEVMLRALSKDLNFSYPLFSQFCKATSLMGTTCNALIPNIMGGRAARFLSLLKLPAQGDYLRFMKEAKSFLLFNQEKPTGQYHLNLNNCCDYSVAEQLIILDSWETACDVKRGHENVSQHGIRCHIRNELYDGRPLVVRGIKEFILPEYGLLKFDYVSSKKPPRDAQPIEKQAFNQLLLALQNQQCTDDEAVKAMCMTAHIWYLDCMQLRSMMGVFKSLKTRADVFVNLSPRILDIYNEKIFRSRFTEFKEYRELQSRLGEAHFFPFIQPEDTTFVLDFAFYDQRLAANILLNISTNENYKNLRNPSFTSANGGVDYLVGGIPPQWMNFNLMEKQGVFQVTYACSPDDRAFKLRKTMLEKYGLVTCPSEKEVLWWSSIHTCPPDVVEFVEFVNSNFGTIWKPFKIMDGDDGNGVLALSEFKDGIKEMKCKKFKGPDEDARLTTIFRYLDPSGEGLVSKHEWAVLDQVLAEVKQSVREFVEFCERTFGPHLDCWWEQLDSDGSGEIDFDEWKATLHENGFFGLASPIFSFLDKDDEGTVSRDEFEVLTEYQGPDWTNSSITGYIPN
eukprot:TRINITY_DN32435_c0_g1_i1.p1 TRINITY_DN32435_c0_g1~~TRINITY_DN32435_c0_g1_i1.p1  ORF type:complete len:1676 (+),score=374.86 TRINITY_DN32435_c0_g1_i1:144-5171(+)